MPSTYTVEAVEKAEIWSNERGEFQAWNVKLIDGQGSYEASVNTKVGNDFPGVGEKVEGDLIPGARGLRFKKAFGGRGGASSNGNGRGGNDYRSPEQIMRGFAHTHALKYWELKHAANPEFTFKSWEDYTRVVDLFHNDIKTAT